MYKCINKFVLFCWLSLIKYAFKQLTFLSTFFYIPDEITVSLSTGVETSSEDLRICVSSSHLAISQSNGTELLKAAFAHPVEPSTATWNIGGLPTLACKLKIVNNRNWKSISKNLRKKYI